jgi:hypothetical protein
MDGPVSELESKVASLAESLRAVEARVAALEAASAPAAGPPDGIAPSGEAVAPSSGVAAATLPGLLALAGRCFLILGGAFLVRTLTDAGALPRGAGVALGLVYALVWLLVADRAGHAGQSLGATAYGLTATAIVCPLVWEAATRLGVFSPAAAAAVLLALAAAALAISLRRDLAGLAWAATLGTLATAFALLVVTHALVTFASALLLLAAASLWVSLQKDWAGLPWPAALAADLVVLEAGWIAGRPGGPPDAYAGLTAGAVVALSLALPVPFLAGGLFRTLVGRRDPVVFDAFQTAVALLIGLSAATRLAPAAGLPNEIMGAGILAAAAVLYAAAFRPTVSGGASLLHSTAALALALAGSRLALPGAAAALLWGAAGLALVFLTPRRGSELLAAQSAVLIAAAALQSGLLAACRDAFVAPPETARAFPPAGAVVLGLTILSTGVLTRRARNRPPGRAGRLVVLALAALSALGAGALAERGLCRVFSAGGDAARTAAVRSAVLAVAALALAACRRVSSVSELSRLAYPLLAAGGLKLLVEDLPHGRPTTLSLAFVLYGAALIAIPRLLRAGATPGPQ